MEKGLKEVEMEVTQTLIEGWKLALAKYKSKGGKCKSTVDFYNSQINDTEGYALCKITARILSGEYAKEIYKNFPEARYDQKEWEKGLRWQLADSIWHRFYEPLAFLNIDDPYPIATRLINAYKADKKVQYYEIVEHTRCTWLMDVGNVIHYYYYSIEKVCGVKNKYDEKNTMTFKTYQEAAKAFVERGYMVKEQAQIHYNFRRSIP